MEMVKKRSSFLIFSITRVCVTLVTLPFTLKKSILRQKKKYYGNSNISIFAKNIIFKKSFKRNPKSFQDIITL
jgi:hypothetical protein